MQEVLTESTATMQEPFDLTFEIDPATLAAVLRRRLFAGSRFLIMLALILALVVWLGFTAGVVFAMAFGSVLLILLGVRWWMAPGQWLRSQPHLCERRTIHVSSERLGLSTETVKSEVPWTYFLCWCETSEYFMLDLTRSGFCSVIPKSAMTRDQEETFREWAKSKLPAYPKRLKR